MRVHRNNPQLNFQHLGKMVEKATGYKKWQSCLAKDEWESGQGWWYEGLGTSCRLVTSIVKPEVVEGEGGFMKSESVCKMPSEDLKVTQI